MSERYWSGEIGGIELLDGADVAGFNLIGAGAFRSNWTGVTTPGVRGYPHTQYNEILYNKTLELQFIHIPQTLADSLLDLLIPLMPSGAGVNCTFQDGFETITGTFTPKAPLSAFYERGQPDGDYLLDFIIRIINIPNS